MTTIPQRLRSIARALQEVGLEMNASKLLEIAVEIEAPDADAVPVVAWLHSVVHSDSSDADEALSFSHDNFPMQGLFRSIAHEPLIRLRDNIATVAALQARINALEARQAELQRISEIGRLAVPPENTPEAAQAIEAALVEYDYPANARNAARAGWRACRRYASAQSWVPLIDEDRTRAFQSLPDMLEGFMKTWGWLHFAKAVEAICREKNSQPDTSKEQP